MKAGARRFGAADRRLLPEGRLAGPMPWVIAIMMFLTVLAAAAGLGLAGAAGRLGEQVGDRVTVQVVEANPEARAAQAAAAAEVLARHPAVRSVRPVPQHEVEALLEPWIGAAGADAGVPVPALIDVDLVAGAAAGPADLRAAIAEAAPAARVDDGSQWLAPLAELISALQWLAAGLVLLMVGATAATVVLAARAALDTHRETIEILHLMGANDRQIARLFQRRIAIDALFGGFLGFAIGALVLVLLGGRVAKLGSHLFGSAALAPGAWAVLAALPAFGILLATFVARTTILRALGRML